MWDFFTQPAQPWVTAGPCVGATKPGDCQGHLSLFNYPLLTLQFGAEFRRFSLDRHKPGKFEDFYQLVVHTHHISNTEVTIGYADVHGDLLPINNDDNFCKAVSSASPLLRVFIQKRGTACRGGCEHDCQSAVGNFRDQNVFAQQYFTSLKYFNCLCTSVSVEI